MWDHPQKWLLRWFPQTFNSNLVAQKKLAKIITPTFVNLIKLKAVSKHELLINKLFSVPWLPMLMQQKIKNDCISGMSPKVVKASTELSLFQKVFQKKIHLYSVTITRTGKNYWKGSLSANDLLTIVASYVKQINKNSNIKQMT